MPSRSLKNLSASSPTMTDDFDEAYMPPGCRNPSSPELASYEAVQCHRPSSPVQMGGGMRKYDEYHGHSHSRPFHMLTQSEALRNTARRDRSSDVCSSDLCRVVHARSYRSRAEVRANNAGRYGLRKLFREWEYEGPVLKNRKHVDNISREWRHEHKIRDGINVWRWKVSDTDLGSMFKHLANRRHVDGKLATAFDQHRHVFADKLQSAKVPVTCCSGPLMHRQFGKVYRGLVKEDKAVEDLLRPTKHTVRVTEAVQRTSAVYNLNNSSVEHIPQTYGGYARSFDGTAFRIR